MAKTNGKGRETEVRKLPVKLTEPELLKRGDEMAACELEIEKQKGVLGGVNSEIKKATKRRKELGHVIDSGTETRDVRCEWIEDFPKNVWRLVRQDTGDEVDSRPMSANDRVGKLPFESRGDDMPPPPRSSKAKAVAPVSDAAPLASPAPKRGRRPKTTGEQPQPPTAA